jgi:hypothetical protein
MKIRSGMVFGSTIKVWGPVPASGNATMLEGSGTWVRELVKPKLTFALEQLKQLFPGVCAFSRARRLLPCSAPPGLKGLNSQAQTSEVICQGFFERTLN